MMKQAFFSVVFGFLVVCSLAVVTMLYIAFSADEQAFFRTGLFGAVYVHVRENAQGNLELSLGIHNGGILLVLIAIASLVIFLGILAVKAVLGRRSTRDDSMQ
ncbi:hypothetical protein GC425_04190 [Corynebacterium sp. zg254]|uniref:Uncharacterized protein n=1 Tax=Corynebacterium zhongnanshanii TaxID=2768834 RepID=A0ABQ6VEM2_9CORY|nr:MULTISPECIES: hypothetical protein [Corynebacterium]KAB3522859.1 hypothetical protein F8377_01430 [Corynebacterium zhongnanshanii]MCR5914070.1 hypothetical protein [Corynebacterium sp. zg254]